MENSCGGLLNLKQELIFKKDILLETSEQKWHHWRPMCIIQFTLLYFTFFQGPLSIIGGIVLGVVCGYLVKYIPERNDAFLVPLRVLLLLVGGLTMVLGSEELGWGGAGKLL